MSKRHKKNGRNLNYVDHLHFVTSTISGCTSISAFTSLVGILIAITSSGTEFKTCVITAGIKKYNSIIRRKRKKHDKIVLLVKSKLNSIEVLISEILIDSNVSYDEFVLVTNVLKDLYDMKEEIKSYNTK